MTAPVHDVSEFETVIGAHARAPNGGLIVMPDAFVNHTGQKSYRWRLTTVSRQSMHID